MRIIEDLLNIIFPKNCCICDSGLSRNEEHICFHCRSELTKTNFTNLHDNELTNRFYGKISIDFGMSYLYFHKSGITQKLMHRFKYNNYPDIGHIIGKWIGYEILTKKLTSEIDIIVPVPLHPKKESKRGYNQSQYFASGISEITKIPTVFDSLIRVDYDGSQTLKSREKRWKSVEHAFEVVNKKGIENKKVLLVDDVMTTGATLEACGHQLIKKGALGICVATMALAK